MQTITTIAVAALMLSATAMGQTHAPWPTDWNNWNDPALWCTVGDPGNQPDTRYAAPGPPHYGDGVGYGAVSYTYRISTFEVTAGQYTAFLNAVAATDTYGLYSASMADPAGTIGCNIQRTGSSGNYRYSVSSDYANRPVNYVGWGDAARFANWQSNGRPTGPQNLSTTEDGSYYLNGATTNAALLAVTRKSTAKYVIPTEDEWYKAAYYKSGSTNAGYWDYPTRTNTAPGRSLADASGDNVNYLDYAAFPIDSGAYYVTVAGEFQNSKSAYGTFDQGGNVFEWNEEIWFGNSRGLRGGSFTYEIRFSSALSGVATDATNQTAEFGFRIVQLPEPATLSLLALGGFALTRKRRK